MELGELSAPRPKLEKGALFGSSWLFMPPKTHLRTRYCRNIDGIHLHYALQWDHVTCFQSRLRVYNIHAVIDQGFSTGSCNCDHALPGRVVDPPTSPVLPFLLAQNLSSKRIAPNNNMRPKSDYAKRHHRLVKG